MILPPLLQDLPGSALFDAPCSAEISWKCSWNNNTCLHLRLLLPTLEVISAAQDKVLILQYITGIPLCGKRKQQINCVLPCRTAATSAAPGRDRRRIGNDGFSHVFACRPAALLKQAGAYAADILKTYANQLKIIHMKAGRSGRFANLKRVQPISDGLV